MVIPPERKLGREVQMAKPGNQKLKILYIIRLLEESDEEHVVTTRDILEELESRGIPAERKGIYDDLEALRAFGFSIIGKRGRSAGYYLEDKEAVPALLNMKPASGMERGTEEAGSEEKTGTEEYAAAQNGEKAQGAAASWLGGDTELLLLCAEKTAGQILSELGECVTVSSPAKKKNGFRIELRIMGSVGPAFFGWLTEKGCQAELLSPASAVRGYRKYLKEIRNLYK